MYYDLDSLMSNMSTAVSIFLVEVLGISPKILNDGGARCALEEGTRPI